MSNVTDRAMRSAGDVTQSIIVCNQCGKEMPYAEGVQHSGETGHRSFRSK